MIKRNQANGHGMRTVRRGISGSGSDWYRSMPGISASESDRYRSMSEISASGSERYRSMSGISASGSDRYRSMSGISASGSDRCRSMVVPGGKTPPTGRFPKKRRRKLLGGQFRRSFRQAERKQRLANQKQGATSEHPLWVSPRLRQCQAQVLMRLTRHGRCVLVDNSRQL